MNPLSYPGPDHLPTAFFQNHWNTMGQDICATILEALNFDIWIDDINETYIALIPNIKTPTKSF